MPYRQKPPGCQGCPLSRAGGGFSHPEGIEWATGKLSSTYNGILIIGEALGFNEMKAGSPFVGTAEAGSCLNAAMRLIGVDRADFGIWNIVACRPPHDKLSGIPKEAEIVEHCSRYLDEVVKKFNPKVILALGAIPLKYLTKFSGVAKEKEGISTLRGYVVEAEKYKCKVVPSLHPSYVNREDRVFLGVLARDIQTAIDAANDKIPEFKTSYILNPSAQDLETYVCRIENDPNLVVAHDIETPNTALTADEAEVDYEVRLINSVQFSIGPEDAIFIHWNEDTIPYIRRIYKTPNIKISWYGWHFDGPILGYWLGEDFMNGLNIDLMTVWKHYNSDFKKMGKELSFATNFASPGSPAWKHLSTNEPEYYGCQDVDNTSRIWQYLIPLARKSRFRSILGKDKPEYWKNYKNVFEGWRDDVMLIWPILKKMAARGIPIDLEAREVFRKKIVAEMAVVLAQVQAVFPKELRGLYPEKGYIRIPPETYALQNIFGNKTNPLSKEFTLYSNEKQAWAEFLEINTRTKEGYSGLVEEDIILENEPVPPLLQISKQENGKNITAGGVITDILAPPPKKIKVRRYCRRKIFKPTSRNMVKDYAKFKGHKLPKSIKGDTDSASKDVIFRAAEKYKDQFYKRVTQYNELSDLNSKYIVGWSKFTDKEGYVHTTFNFNPATGQLAAVNPNVLNAPSHGNQFSSPGYKGLATEFKSLIRAKPDHVIYERDYSSFHALTMAFEAEDPSYMRFVKCDVHTFISAHFIRGKAQIKRDYDIAKGKPQNPIVTDILKDLADLDLWPALDDDSLKKKLKYLRNKYEQFRMVRETVAKPAVHGIGFGLGPNKLYRMNKESFTKVEEAATIINLIKKLFPKIVYYQDRARQHADRYGEMVSRSGGRRAFYDVYDKRILKFRRDPRMGEIITEPDASGRIWLITPGDQAEAAIAYLPANNAFSRMKEAMRDLEDGGYAEKFGMFNAIHDSIMFHVPIKYLAECHRITGEIMDAPSRILINNVAPDGLVCLTEAKVGLDWGHMEEYDEEYEQF